MKHVNSLFEKFLALIFSIVAITGPFNISVLAMSDQKNCFVPLNSEAIQYSDKNSTFVSDNIDEDSTFVLVNSNVQISDDYHSETVFTGEFEETTFDNSVAINVDQMSSAAIEMPGDPMVYLTQRWLNREYGNVEGFGSVPEDGKTGWDTVYGLLRALQHELGIFSLTDSFGPTTTELYEKNILYRQDGVTNRKFAILQGALWCKGYNPGYHLRLDPDDIVVFDEVFNASVERAIIELKQDAGFLNPDGVVTLNVMKALMSMDSFKLLKSYGGQTHVRMMQQELNRKYEDYTGLTPCDGVYGRNTNKAIIYALQAEEGLPLGVANGNFGETTKLCLPQIPYNRDSTAARRYPGTSAGAYYTDEQISSLTKLMQFALFVNGYGNGSFDGIYTSTTQKDLQNFQKEYVIQMTGIVDKGTWMSLFISCGDITRNALAADCATILTLEKAQTLYSNGYRIVGRYLTGTYNGGISKAITKEEAQIIFDAGLRFFPIYQTSATYLEYFTEDRGIEDAEAAIDAATLLGVPEGTIIYFAVDFDSMDYQITSNIIPYFKNIHEKMSTSIYKTGIYGTRNTCSRVSALGYACSSFVGDMSTGFSGNLGFSMPNNWAFDQFTTITIGTGDGIIEIDKDAFSGRDQGVEGLNHLVTLGIPSPPTIEVDDNDGLIITIESNYSSNPNAKIYYSVENAGGYDYFLEDAYLMGGSKPTKGDISYKTYNWPFSLSCYCGSDNTGKYKIKAYVETTINGVLQRSSTQEITAYYNGSFNPINQRDIDEFRNKFSKNFELSESDLDFMLNNIDVYDGQCAGNRYYRMITYYGWYDAQEGSAIVARAAKISRFIVYNVRCSPNLNGGNQQISAIFEIVMQRGLALAEDSSIVTNLDSDHIDLIRNIWQEHSSVVTKMSSSSFIREEIYGFADLASAILSIVKDIPDPNAALISFVKVVNRVSNMSSKETNDILERMEFDSTYYQSSANYQDAALNTEESLSKKAVLTARNSLFRENDTLSLNTTILYPQDGFLQTDRVDEFFGDSPNKEEIRKTLYNEYSAQRTVSTMFQLSFIPNRTQTAYFTSIDYIPIEEKNNYIYEDSFTERFSWTNPNSASYPSSINVTDLAFIRLTTIDDATPVILDQDGDLVDITFISSVTQSQSEQSISSEEEFVLYAAERDIETAQWEALIKLTKCGLQTLHVFDPKNMDEELISFDITVYDDEPKVAMKPTANPESSQVPMGTLVSLHTATDEANIYYTMDGSDPDLSSNVNFYTDPIQINTDTTIKAIAISSNTQASDIATFIYKIVKKDDYLSGVRVAGRIQSYNPKNETTIQLIQSDDVSFQIKIPPDEGFGQVKQEFSFENVAPGIYTLIISKLVHTKFIVQTIIVGDKDVDLIEDSRQEVRLMNLRCGDINDDGMIDDRDLTILWLPSNYYKNTTQAANSLCDLNGDGVIDDRDLTILWMANNYYRGEVVIP